MRTQGLVAMKTFPRLRAKIRETVFRYVLQHSHDYFSNHFAGNIANKISDLPSSVERMLEILIFNFISFSVAFFSSFILLWKANPIFALIILSWATLHLTIGFLFLRTGNTLAIAHSDAVSTLSGKIVDSFTNILNVRLFSRNVHESLYLGRYQQDEILKSKQASWHLEKMKLWQGFFYFRIYYIHHIYSNLWLGTLLANLR